MLLLYYFLILIKIIFFQITQEQNIVQKHLENARKQFRQHGLVLNDYTTKKSAKQQQQQQQANIAPPSPLMSPSPSSQNMIPIQPVQSPLGNHPIMQQPIQSPLQSPSPLMLSQSPGPSSVNSILQSPHAHSMPSPYNSMQQSPRNNNTPHLQNDETAFSPGSNSGLTSPHRNTGTPIQMMNRIGGTTQQQFIQNNQQNQFINMGGNNNQVNVQQQNQQMQMQSQRFVRTTQMVQNDNRMRQQNFQQVQQQQILVRQQSQNNTQPQNQSGGYSSPLGHCFNMFNNEN